MLQPKTVAELVRESFLRVRASRPWSNPLTQEQMAWLRREPYPSPEETRLAPMPGKFREALEAMRNPEFLASIKHQEQHLRVSREGAHPAIVGDLAQRGFLPVFLRRMGALGVPMFAHCIWRSEEVQDELFRAGRSKAKAGQSAHNYGCALDFVHGTEGWNLNEQQWSVVGHVGKEVALSLGLKVVWGGDWKFYDPAHWELADWRVIRGVFQSYPEISTVPQALALLAKERSQS